MKRNVQPTLKSLFLCLAALLVIAHLGVSACAQPPRVDELDVLRSQIADLQAQVQALQACAVSGYRVHNPQDAPALAQITLSAGLTATQKRYLAWRDFDQSLAGYFGWNAGNAIILYQAAGGPANASYHVLYAARQASGGVTLLNSASAVYINQDGTATGSGGLVVWDGSPNTAVSAANKYGSINVLGVQANNGRDVRAFAPGDKAYTRLVTSSAGYLDSTLPLRIRSAANLIVVVDSAYAERLRIDASTGHVALGTATPAQSALLDLSSTNAALLLPRLTTAQRDALQAVDGMLVYNTSIGVVQARTHGAWTDL